MGKKNLPGNSSFSYMCWEAKRESTRRVSARAFHKAGLWLFTDPDNTYIAACTGPIDPSCWATCFPVRRAPFLTPGVGDILFSSAIVPIVSPGSPLRVKPCTFLFLHASPP